MDVELNPRAIEIIDSCMDKDKPMFDYGLEKFCCETLKNMTDIEFRKKLSTRLTVKGKSRIVNDFDRKYDTYFSGSSSLNYFLWHGRSPWGYQKFLEAKCKLYFERISIKLLQLFIKEEYGDMELAIMLTDCFLDLFNSYEQWFENRRMKFMENMEVDIQKVREMSVKKTPQSHGGVANLLKVLTKTMEKQGSDIQNIAKVQYAVCVQAGIYIPDEFIRDVAVTLNMELQDKELKVEGV